MAFSMSNGGGGDEDSYAPMAEMNVIPLVDVMLVLLIIMMVTAPFIEQGVNVELPSTQGQNLQKNAADAEPVILFVSRDRKLKLGNVSVERSELPARLKQIFSRRQIRELFVRADKDVPYGVVADIMARVQNAGVERVGLVTQPE